MGESYYGYNVRIAKDLPPETISRSWIAKTLNRSEDFVKINWNKDPSNCEMDSNKRATMKVSHKKAKIIFSPALQKRKSVQRIIKEIEEVCEKVKSYGCVYRYLRFFGTKPFNQVPS